MTVEEFLKRDTSYNSYPFSKGFFGIINSNKERKAYEEGVKNGWYYGIKNMLNSCTIPHNMELSMKDYQDLMSLLSALGYTFTYINNPNIENIPGSNLHPGLNVCKNKDAMDAGVVVSDEIKQKIFKLLKENSDKRLWNH